jgi:tRNA U55 pseudouridine synthase TruB
VICYSGTYIIALASYIGRSLGTYATLIKLIKKELENIG